MSLTRRLDQVSGSFFLALTAAAAIVAVADFGRAPASVAAAADQARAEAVPLAGPSDVSVSNVSFAPKPRQG